MNRMEDFSFMCKVCRLPFTFGLLLCVIKLVFNFLFDVINPSIPFLRTTYSSDLFVEGFCYVHLFKSKLDELPGRSPAIPCNVLGSLQPVNQLEAGIANENAGELLPFFMIRFCFISCSYSFRDYMSLVS